MVERIGGGVIRLSLLSRQLTEGHRFRQAFSRFIQGNIEFAIADGDMTRVEGKGAAWVVPHFQGAVSYGGVGGAVLRAGGQRGLEALEPLIKSMRFGDAVVTEAGNAKVGKLIQVVSVGSEKDEEYGVVKQAVKRALEVAEEAGIETVVFPALGTGIIGQLTATQSAHAMLSAVREHQGTKVKQIMVVLYRNDAAYHEFIRVYNHPTEVVKTVGEKEFNAAAWAVGMTLDSLAQDTITLSPDAAEILGAEEITRLLEEHHLPEALDAFADVIAKMDAEKIDLVRATFSADSIAAFIKAKYSSLKQDALDQLVGAANQVAQQYLACFAS